MITSDNFCSYTLRVYTLLCTSKKIVSGCTGCIIIMIIALLVMLIVLGYADSVEQTATLIVMQD